MTQKVTLDGLGWSRFTNVALDPLGAAMLSLLRCTGIGSRSAVYVSTPLTSGEIVIDWHERAAAGEDSPRPSREAVFRENSTRARALIGDVRARFQAPVIEPASLQDVPEWKQRDYHAFWCSTIEQLAYAVVFNEGWNYSTGCVTEFATAVLTGADLYDASLHPMTPAAGLLLIEESRDRIKRASLPADAFDEVVASLEELIRG